METLRTRKLGKIDKRIKMKEEVVLISNHYQDIPAKTRPTPKILTRKTKPPKRIHTLNAAIMLDGEESEEVEILLTSTELQDDQEQV